MKGITEKIKNNILFLFAKNQVKKKGAVRQIALINLPAPFGKRNPPKGELRSKF
ncbi:MAG: hypothetical protein II610_02395 [Treponema sp.]|nr:hypothetical protein [Treponema sp.]